MALSTNSTKKTTFGNKKILIIDGEFENGDTSGSITTGLNKIDFAIAQYKAAAKIINCEENSSTGGQLDLDTEDPGATKEFTAIVVGH